MSALPHPSWCALERCDATDLEGAGAHRGEPAGFSTGAPYRHDIIVQLYRVDSTTYGHPWVIVALTDDEHERELMLRPAQARELAALLVGQAERADADEVDQDAGGAR